MGDLFDEFMKELRRRQREAAGGSERNPRGESEDRDGDAVSDDGSVDDDPNDRRAQDDGSNGHPHLRPVPAADDEDVDSDADERDARDDPQPAGAGRGPGGSGSVGGSGGRSGGGGGGRRSGIGGPRDGAPSIRSRVLTAIAIVVVVFVLVMLLVGLQLWTDAIWFKSVGFDSVFWTRIGAQVVLWLAAFAVVLLFLLGNIWLAGRMSPPSGSEGGTLRSWIDRLSEAAAAADRQRARGPWDPWGGRRPDRDAVQVSPLEIPDPVPLGRVVIIAIAILVALTFAGTVSGTWETILLWIHRVPFDPTGKVVPDPVFGKDISFYLFDLPLYRFLQATIAALLVAALIASGARYLLSAVAGAAVFDTRVRVHLGVLAALFLMTVALGYQLDKLDLVHNTRLPAQSIGVSYTDANAQFLAFDVLTALSAIAAALLLGGMFARVWWPVAITVAVWFIASVGIGQIYPEIVQRITVQPNQATLEAPYLSNNISMTRLAFGLDDWTTDSYTGDQPLTPAAVQADADTFANARLWDYRPLGDTLNQLQTIKQYYDFYDVDTDRYMINGKLTQVMLSARELALDKNPNATGWVNQHLIYTHGFGAAMVPVSSVTTQGQPDLDISNIPPVSVGGAPPITEPRIYFGERPSDYVIVGAQQNEFDYAQGNSEADSVTNRWTGTTGISLDSFVTRLLFALRFRDFDMLISNQITSQSQLLMNRSLGDRLPEIAPFLRYDKDPYLVIDNGRLKYVQDAFTTSDEFPDAQDFDPADLNAGTGLAGDPFNYIRNSVKIVEDAYDGTMTFYVADQADPLIRAWEGVFPDLFKPISDLPTELQPHLRVPEELFDVQTQMFGRYHVTDPGTFYAGTDNWTVPMGQTNQQSLPTEAYYVAMRQPGDDQAAFLLLQPMIPKSRPNMIAWVAAKNGPEDYGKVTVFRFPSDTTIFGPAQVEAQIDIDPDISAQITLWNQSGSTVVRGNLIVLPVGNSLIYLQPVYLQSNSAKFPAFERIVVASSSHVVWAPTLGEALTKFLAEEAAGVGGPSPSPSPSPGESGAPSPSPSASSGPVASPPSGDVASLVADANRHFALAEQALRSGDFARYGAEIALVQQDLNQLQALTGGATPSGAPSLGSPPPTSPAPSPAPSAAP